MESVLSTNIFRGIDYDALPEASRPDKYEMALNAVKKSNDGDRFGLVNEGSTWKPVSLPGKIVGYGFVEARNWLVVLLEGGDLGYFDTKLHTYTRIYGLDLLDKISKDKCNGKDKESLCTLDFKTCEFIPIEHNFWNNCSELHIEFSYNCNLYTINVDELLNPDRAKHVSCEDIKTFECECIPFARPVTAEGGGAGVPNGKYRFTLRLINKDGHRSNFYNITKEVFIGSDKNIPGEISNQFINIWISGMHCNYSAMELVVIRSIGDGATAEILDRIEFGGGTISYEYRGPTGRETPIPLAEVLVKKDNYPKARGVKIFDGKMFYWQLRNHRNINMQAIANNADVELLVFKVHSKVSHLYTGLQMGEGYRMVVAGQWCDGTETAAGVLSNISTLESRTGAEPTAATDEVPTDGTDGGSGGGGSGGSDPATTSSGGKGGNGSITFDNSGNDEYKTYKDLPKDDRRVQEDGFYTDGCVTGTGACDDLGKAFSDAGKAIADELPEDSDEGDSAGDCLECGSETKPKGFLTGLKKFISKALFGLFSIGNSKNRKNKKASQSANGLKQVLQNILKEFELEEVHTPVRDRVNITNSKKSVPTAPIAKSETGDISEQYDNTNITFLYAIQPEWVETEDRYPTTRNCEGRYIYGPLAGQKERLMRVPIIKHFESPTVGAKSSKTIGVDETEGYVILIGFRVNNVNLPTDNLPKPWCDNEPWKVGIMPRDFMNSRVLGCGLAVSTFEGEVDGRPHAIPKNGLNGPELIDRFIAAGGDEFEHEGVAGTLPIYTFYGPDTMLGKQPLVATHVIPIGNASGDGWRHGLYAEATKRVGFFERAEDQKGARSTINLHSFTSQVGDPVAIRGISYCKADRTLAPPPGIDLPLCNLARESAVYMQLASSIGNPTDKSFIADCLDHAGLVYSAESPMVLIIREMPRQYGSFVGAKYVDLGLYAKAGQTSVGGLVGDSFTSPYCFRRTAYISNRVGPRTFFASPRKWPGIARFFGFGDPTEPPESGDTRDPKNKANRHENQGLNAAATQGAGATSVYYPGVAKFLIWGWYMSRVNPHYRQRGEENLGQVHGGNLGTMYLDSSVPKGTPWEVSYLNRYYKEILRESKFHSVLRPAIRFACILGIPLYYIVHGFAIFGNLDFILGFWIRIAIFLLLWLLSFLWIFTNSRINRMMGLKEQLNDDQGGADEENIRQFEDNYLEYSSEYNVGSSVSTITGITDPYNVCVCNNCKEYDYSTYTGEDGVNNLIKYSARQYANTEINAFKHVLDGDYGEMQTNTSQIQKLFSLNNMLYAITTDGIWRLSYSGNVNYRGVEHLLGNGQALGTPHRIGEGVPEGIYGTIDPNSITITPIGAVIIDAKADVIYLFDGSNVRPILNGIEEIAQNYLKFCGEKVECRDQKMKGQWYSTGYDPELKRILVTKRDSAGGSSWTMSYDIEEQQWISAHSYTPDFYFNDRKQMFSVKDNKIWCHNDPKSKQTFYGEYHPFKVWGNMNKYSQTEQTLADMMFSRIEFHTIATDLKANLRNVQKTFTKAGFATSYQTTGVYSLDASYYKDMAHKDIKEKKFIHRIYRAGTGGRGPWRFDGFKDKIKNKDSAILKQEECSFLKEFDESNTDYSKGDGNNSPMRDFYLRQMYSFDDPGLSHIELKLLRTIVYGEIYSK